MTKPGIYKMTIRSFIALPLPEHVSAILGDHAARLSSQDKEGKVRWIAEENYHVTLAFLDEVDEQELDDLALDIANASDGWGEVELHVMSVALFPFGKRPRLIAGMLDASSELQKLYQVVARCVRQRAIALEKRRFQPHVTLGRLRGGGARRLSFPPTSIDLHGTVQNLIIFESTLTSEGAIYDQLYELPLA
jgi:2'-5' RNA ligase